MKKHSILSVAAILTAAFFIIGSAVAQDKKMSDEEAKMMAEFMKYATPDEHHKTLEPMIGKWTYTSKYWMAPDSPQQESKGTSEAMWLLGGRYLQENVNGEMMGGQFNGVGFTGYDLIKKEYINYWMDDMSTAPMISRGQIDASGKTITFMGTYPDVMQGMKDVTYKTVIKITGADQHVMEMYMVGEGGKEFKNMEISYTRAK